MNSELCLSGCHILDIALKLAFTSSPSIAPSPNPSIFNNSYLNLPTFSAIQTLFQSIMLVVVEEVVVVLTVNVEVVILVVAGDLN